MNLGTLVLTNAVPGSIAIADEKLTSRYRSVLNERIGDVFVAHRDHS